MHLVVQVNFTSNCNYDYEMFYLDNIINYTQANLCPDLVKSEVDYNHFGSLSYMVVYCIVYSVYYSNKKFQGGQK